MTCRKIRPGPAGALALAFATLVLTATATPAVARPDGGEAVTQTAPSQGDCPLRRVDRQLVRCDLLTGAGAEAPLAVRVQ